MSSVTRVKGLRRVPGALGGRIGSPRFRRRAAVWLFSGILSSVMAHDMPIRFRFVKGGLRMLLWLWIGFLAVVLVAGLLEGGWRDD